MTSYESGGGAEKVRLKKGLSNEEIIILGCKMGLEDVLLPRVYAHDVLPVQHLIKTFKKRGRKEMCFIINTGDKDTAGEHWQTIWCQDNTLDYFDPYGLPPVQARTWTFIEDLQANWDFNEDPVQNYFNRNSMTCGYHCLFYLFMKHEEPQWSIKKIVSSFYDLKNLKFNDDFVKEFGEMFLNDFK